MQRTEIRGGWTVFGFGWLDKILIPSFRALRVALYIFSLYISWHHNELEGEEIE